MSASYIDENIGYAANYIFSQITSKNLKSSISFLGLIPVTLLSAYNFAQKSSSHILEYLNDRETLMKTIGNISYDILEFVTVKNIAMLVGAATSLAVGTIPVIGIILPAAATILAGDYIPDVFQYIGPKLKDAVKPYINGTAEYTNQILSKVSDLVSYER